MQQIQIGNQYHYQLFIDDKLKHDFVIRQPKSFQDVTFYASHPTRWIPANVIISHFKIDENFGGS